MSAADGAYLAKFTARKASRAGDTPSGAVPDSLEAWIDRYLALAVRGVRSVGVADKIARHLARFTAFFGDAYGHDRLSTCLRRDVVAWQAALTGQGLAPATVNNHLASLSAFTTWVGAQAPHLFPSDDPVKGIGTLGLAPLEPRALRPEQVRTLKSLCDRLEGFHRRRGRHRATRDRGCDAPVPLRAHGRPWRDRAIVYVPLALRGDPGTGAALDHGRAPVRRTAAPADGLPPGGMGPRHGRRGRGATPPGW